MARGERYTKLFPSLFRNRECRELSHEAFRIYVGAFGHDACHLSGVYEISLEALFHWSSVDVYEGWRVAHELVPRFIEYCDAHSLLWVRGRARREMTGSPKLLVGIQNEVALLPGCRIVAAFLDKYPLEDAAEPPWDRAVCIPYGYPIDNQTKPNQNQTKPQRRGLAPGAVATLPPGTPGAPASDPPPGDPPGTTTGRGRPAQDPQARSRRPRRRPQLPPGVACGSDQQEPAQRSLEGVVDPPDPPDPPGGKTPRDKRVLPRDRRIRTFLEHAKSSYLEHRGKPLVITRGKDAKLVRGWLQQVELPALQEAWTLYVSLPDNASAVAWIKNGRTVGAFGSCLTGLLEGDKPRHRRDEYGHEIVTYCYDHLDEGGEDHDQEGCPFDAHPAPVERSK